MSIQEHKRFDLAANQLKTAIKIFLTAEDYISATTLAGAADVIFCELVKRQGKDNFTDCLLKNEKSSFTRQSIGKEVNTTLGINALKHFDPEDSEYISLNIGECAVGSILKAIVNYKILNIEYDISIQGFLIWCEINLDKNKYKLL